MPKHLGSYRLHFLAGTVAMALFGTAGAASAATLTTLYSFTGGSDGGLPAAGLTLDSHGNLYGTASSFGGSGFGVVFELLPPAPGGTSWTQSVLYSFQGGADGASPYGDLIFDKLGKLYGTTVQGGALDQCNDGCGTIFSLAPPRGTRTQWRKAVLHSFARGSDGLFTYSGLLRDRKGNLYGSTNLGGVSDGGTVFALLRPKSAHMVWPQIPLHSFGGGGDGINPYGDLLSDKNGNLFGTTNRGGAFNAGMAYELSPPALGQTNWTETILHSFSFGADGAIPAAGLIQDQNGNLYGTTPSSGPGGGGTVFMLSPPAPGQTGWTETLLYGFSGGADGATPASPLVRDQNGNLYGETRSGGGFSSGAVFELSPPAPGQTSWTETILYGFTGGADGYQPGGGLVRDAAGNLYGVTFQGGASARGTVFEITP